MLAEPLAHGDSFIYRIDPRLRVVAAAVFSCTVAVFESFPALTLASAAALALLLCSSLDRPAVGRRLAVVSGFLVLLWLILPLTYEGPVIARMGRFALYQEGVALAARISLKSLAIIAVFTALAATMPIGTLGQTLGRLRVPDKLIYLLLIVSMFVQ